MNEAKVINENIETLFHNKIKLNVSHKKIIWCEVQPRECICKNNQCKLK